MARCTRIRALNWTIAAKVSGRLLEFGLIAAGIWIAYGQLSAINDQMDKAAATSHASFELSLQKIGWELQDERNRIMKTDVAAINLHLNKVISYYSMMYDFRKLHQIRKDVWKTMLIDMREFFSQKLVQAIWKRKSKYYGDEFPVFVTMCLMKSDKTKCKL